MGEINKAADFHPLSHVLGKNNALIDPIAQGDVNMIGDAGPGTGAYNHAQNLGATDMLNTVQLFGKVIAGGAAMGAAGGGEAAAGTDLEAAGTSAGAAGSVGESGATSVTQAQAASAATPTGETLGSGESVPVDVPETGTPSATPEPSSAPSAPAPRSAPDVTITDKAAAPTTILDSLKTAATILTPVSSLLAVAAGSKKPKSSSAAPPPPPPPPALPVAGSRPIVERSIIQAQIARRGRASTILTSDDKLGS